MKLKQYSLTGTNWEQNGVKFKKEGYLLIAPHGKQNERKYSLRYS